MPFAAGQVAGFQGGPMRTGRRVGRTRPRLKRRERATRKNSQLGAARRVAMKMGRRLRCSSVTYRFRYAPLLPPCRRPILIATKGMLFRGQGTGSTATATAHSTRGFRWRASACQDPEPPGYDSADFLARLRVTCQRSVLHALLDFEPP